MCEIIPVTTKELIRASDDIVWESNEDAYTAARELMHATMSRSFLPFHVHATRSWAVARAAAHQKCAETFEQIVKRIECEEDAPGVWRLIHHHRRIAARYTAVADAMQD